MTYLTIFKLILALIMMVVFITPLFKNLYEPVLDVIDCTAVGDLLETAVGYLNDGFDEFSEALLFLGAYIMYLFLCGILAAIFSICWIVVIPLLAIAILVYSLKRNN